MSTASRSSHREALLVAAVLAAAITGCRGQVSEDPPIHPISNMGTQSKYKAQAESKFFPDRRTMRQPVEGTVAFEPLMDDEMRSQGFKLVKGPDGKPVRRYQEYIPVAITEGLLKRGQDRFNIYCVPCHSMTGNGNGMVAQRAAGALHPANFQLDYTRSMTDGQVYAAITYGANTMQPYAAQIPSMDDRWAIVAYVRALEIAQNATLADVPPEKRGSLPQETAP